MDVIKTLTDVVTLAQKSNDIEMIQKVINAQQEILNMQDEMLKLKKENEKLKDEKKNGKNIERYRNITIITLKNDEQKIKYCSRCWDKDRKLIQVNIAGDSYMCPECKTRSYISYTPDKINK